MNEGACNKIQKTRDMEGQIENVFPALEKKKFFFGFFFDKDLCLMGNIVILQAQTEVSAVSSYVAEPLTIQTLGYHTWTMLHSLVHSSFWDQEPSTDIREEETFVQAVKEVILTQFDYYACIQCRQHVRAILQQHPRAVKHFQQIQRQKDLSKWLSQIHNEVNLRLGHEAHIDTEWEAQHQRWDLGQHNTGQFPDLPRCGRTQGQRQAWPEVEVAKPLTKVTLGHSVWTALHSLVHSSFRLRDTVDEEKSFIERVKFLLQTEFKYYPCFQCRKHIQQILQEHKYSQTLQDIHTQVGLSRWLAQLHNTVNLALGAEAHIDVEWEAQHMRWGLTKHNTGEFPPTKVCQDLFLE